MNFALTTNHGLHLSPVITSIRGNLHPTERLWLVSPFVTGEGIREILAGKDEGSLDLRLITRLSERDFVSGVSDVQALIDFIDLGGAIHAHPESLHAKTIITSSIAYVGSSNLTGGGLVRNVEAMCGVGREELIRWFTSTWNTTSIVTRQQLESLKREVNTHPAGAALRQVRTSHFRDFALDLLRLPTVSNVRTPRAENFRPRRSMLKLTGYSGGPLQSDASKTFASSIGREGAQCFSRIPNIAVGDKMFLCTMYRSASGRSARAIYGRGIVDRAQMEVDVMPAGLFDGVPGVPDRITDWPRIVWLRDLSIINCSLDKALNPYDADQITHPLDLSQSRQGSHFFPSQTSMDEIDTAMEQKFEQHGVTFMEKPDDIWWNTYLPLDRRLRRSDFEANAPTI